MLHRGVRVRNRCRWRDDKGGKKSDYLCHGGFSFILVIITYVINHWAAAGRNIFWSRLSLGDEEGRVR